MTPPERLQDVTLAERLQSVMDEMRASLEKPEDNGGWWEHAVSGWLADIEAAAALSVRGWLPIESAPRDELILVGPTKRMGICVAMNHSRDGWVTETCSEWSCIYTPTHWQPLPATPPSEG